MHHVREWKLADDDRNRPGAAQGHPAAGTVAWRRAARPRGRCDVRGGRGDPPDRAALPPRRRTGGSPSSRYAAAPAVARRHDRRRPCVQLLLPPREHRRGPSSRPPPAGQRLDATRYSGACDGGIARARRRSATPVLAARRRLPDAGADRASDRGAAQEHPRCRTVDRRTDRSARGRARGSPRGDRRGAAGRHLDALADADAAAREAQRLRRDRQRARLLAHHVPA